MTEADLGVGTERLQAYERLSPEGEEPRWEHIHKPRQRPSHAPCTMHLFWPWSTNVGLGESFARPKTVEADVKLEP